MHEIEDVSYEGIGLPRVEKQVVCRREDLQALRDRQADFQAFPVTHSLFSSALCSKVMATNGMVVNQNLDESLVVNVPGPRRNAVCTLRTPVLLLAGDSLCFTLTTQIREGANPQG